MGDGTELGAMLPPLDWRPGAGQMRSGHLRGFFWLAQQYGGDPRALLERHEINPVTFADPDNFVDCSAAVAVLEDCGARFRDPLFGARLARLQSADVFGYVTALGRAASTFREGVQCFIDYLPVLHSSEGAIQMVHNEHRAEHRWTGEGLFATNLQGNYQSLILQLKMLQMLGGPEFRPDYVLMRADISRREIDELEKWLGCRVDSRQDHNAIGFPAHVLDWPILTSNKLLFTLLKTYIENIRQNTMPSLSDKVSAYVRTALPTGHCSLTRCAETLGMSRRMLQWRLEAENRQFSDMVEQERIALARTLLVESRLSIVEIAAMLGYSEQSSFGRACRRWFGVSPGSLRSHGDVRH